MNIKRWILRLDGKVVAYLYGEIKELYASTTMKSFQVYPRPDCSICIFADLVEYTVEV